MSSYRDRFEIEVNRVGVSRIAQTLGIARNTVYNWMANANVPLNQLLALEGLGIDIVYVLTGVPQVRQDEPLQASQDVRPYGLSDDENILVERYRRSSTEVRAAALRMLSTPTEPPPLIKPPKRLSERDSDLPEKSFKKPLPRGET